MLNMSMKGGDFSFDLPSINLFRRANISLILSVWQFCSKKSDEYSIVLFAFTLLIQIIIS